MSKDWKFKPALDALAGGPEAVVALRKSLWDSPVLTHHKGHTILTVHSLDDQDYQVLVKPGTLNTEEEFGGPTPGVFMEVSIPTREEATKLALAFLDK